MPPNGLDTAGTYFARASHWSPCAALQLSIGEKPRLNTGLFVTEPSTTIAVAAAGVCVVVSRRRDVLCESLVISRLSAKRLVDRLGRNRRVEHVVLADLQAFAQRLTRDHVPELLRHEDAFGRNGLRSLNVAPERSARALCEPDVVLVVQPVEPAARKPAVVPAPREHVEVGV